MPSTTTSTGPRTRSSAATGSSLTDRWRAATGAIPALRPSGDWRVPYAFVEDIAASWEHYDRFAAAFEDAFPSGPHPPRRRPHGRGLPDHRRLGERGRLGRFPYRRLEPRSSVPRPAAAAHVSASSSEASHTSSSGGHVRMTVPARRSLPAPRRPRRSRCACTPTPSTADGPRRARIAVAGSYARPALLATAAAAAPARRCAVCGKNLIKNPGAEGGAGITAVDAFGAVPGWTNEAGQFGAASYTFPNGWFSKTSKGPKDRGKNYFFGGTTGAAVAAPGDDRQADDQAPCRGSRQEGNAQRLARQLREELRAGAGPVRGRDRRRSSAPSRSARTRPSRAPTCRRGAGAPSRFRPAPGR